MLKDVLRLLDLMVEMQDVYDMIEGFKLYSEFKRPIDKKEMGKMLGAPEDEAEEFIKNIEEFPTMLLKRASELSFEEAIELREMTEGTAKGAVFMKTFADPDIPTKLKYKVYEVFWPAERFGEKTLKKSISEIRTIELPKNLDYQEVQLVQEKRNQLLTIFIPLQKMYDLNFVDDEFLAITLDVIRFEEPEDIDYLNEKMGELVCYSESFEILEILVEFWKGILPKRCGQRLRRLSLEANSLEAKNNIKNALILVGGGQIVENKTININASKSIINVESTLDNVTQTINNSDLADEATRAELSTLILRLKELLAHVPEDHEQEAAAVAVYAERLVEEATQEPPNEVTKKITSDGLLQAAKNISKVTSAILPIVKQIISLIV